MTCECYAVLTDPERKALFAGIFTDDHVPITPKEGTSLDPLTGEPYDYWLLDQSRVTEEQKSYQGMSQWECNLYCYSTTSGFLITIIFTGVPTGLVGLAAAVGLYIIAQLYGEYSGAPC